MHKKWLLILLCSIFWIAGGFTSHAQFERFVFINDTNVDLDETAIREAAQALIDNHRARVAVVIVTTGGAYDFETRLESYNMVTNSRTNSNVFAIYIALEEQYSLIRWGESLDRIDGDKLRSNNLNPMLRDRNFTAAVVDTLTAADAQLSNVFSGMTLSCLYPLVVVIMVIYFIVQWIRNPDSVSWSSSNTDNDSSSYSRSSSRSSSRSDNSRSKGGGSSGGSWND